VSEFETSLRLLNEAVDEDLEVSIIPSPRTTLGDVTTIGEFEGLGENERLDTEQHTIQFINENLEYYARVIIHILDDIPAALIDWVEVVDEENRGNGIGRALHEEAAQYIDKETGAERIYTKVENPKMVSVNVDTGFQQVESSNKDIWYVRQK
jgi:GNAT superfamily N-acetyltransferase